MMDTPLVLLTGPAGAGKTAAADAWARRQQRPTLHLSLDDLRDRVKADYANPEDGATPAMFRQLELARTGCALLAKLYVADGFACVIDDAIFPGWPAAGLDSWLEALRPLSPVLIVLLPDLPTILRRNQGRTGHRRLREHMLRTIYEQMLPWREEDVSLVDTTDLSVEQTADCIDAIVAAYLPSAKPADP